MTLSRAPARAKDSSTQSTGQPADGTLTSQDYLLIRKQLEHAKTLERGDDASKKRETTFLMVPNRVLRLAMLSPWLVLVVAARVHRRDREWSFWLLKRWFPSMSRATAYRHLRAVHTYVDDDGQLRPEAVSEDGGNGFVKVLLSEVTLFGPLKAILLGLLRNWRNHPSVQSDKERAIRKDGSFEAVAQLLADAIGYHERTVRVALQELSTGAHRKDRKPQKYLCPRLALTPAAGKPTFVRILPHREVVDALNQIDAWAKKLREKVEERPAPTVQAEKERAAAAHQQSIDGDREKQAFENAGRFLELRPALLAWFGFLSRCKPRKKT